MCQIKEYFNMKPATVEFRTDSSHACPPCATCLRKSSALVVASAMTARRVAFISSVCMGEALAISFDRQLGPKRLK